MRSWGSTVSSRLLGSARLAGATNFSESGAALDAAFLGSVAPQGSGFTFDLGTLTNLNANNAVAETVTIQYDVVVLNDSSVQDGSALNNSATLTATGAINLSASAENIEIIEPELEVQKSVTVNGMGNQGDAGDIVEYTFVIAHTGTDQPDAFDVSFMDVLPDAVGSPTITNVTDSNGTLGISDFEIAGSTLQIQGAGTIDMPSNRVVTIVVRGELTTDVAPGERIENTAEIDWSSLNGDVQDTSPFVDDGRDAERGGAGGVDDYRADDTATIIVNVPVLTKTLVATSEDHTGTVRGIERVAIGEIVRYRLQVELPEGTHDGFRILDRLPSGMTFLPGSERVALVATDTAELTSVDVATNGGEDWSVNDPAAFVTGNEDTIDSITPVGMFGTDNTSRNAFSLNASFGTGTDIYFKFGDVVNADNDDDIEYLLVEFDAIVDNLNGNQENRRLHNRFQVDENGEIRLGGLSNSVQVRVAEPDVTINKSISTAPLDANDTIEYEIEVTNRRGGAGDTTGFDINVTDNLDQFMPPGTLSLVSVTADVSNAPTAIITDATSGNMVDVTIDRLEVRESVTFVVVATVNSNVPAGERLDNTGERHLLHLARQRHCR